MELEQRVAALEQEVKILKTEIQGTLIEIQESLPAQPPAAPHWQRRAWVLALVNVLLAVVLFMNIYLYVPGIGNAPFELSPTLAAWLRALWVAMAFVWLLLQLYPLALLLEQEDQQWQDMAWRNARTLFRHRPTLMVGLTLATLVVAIINTIIPAVWLMVATALLAGVGAMLVQSMLELFRAQARSMD
jgi:hypothetical protein